jgi:hypothetical protein
VARTVPRSSRSQPDQTSASERIAFR